MADILKVAVDNLQVLQSILSPTFGPNGVDIALQAESGGIVVTNSGHLILSSLSMTHPVGIIVHEQVRGHLGLTGDGSKEIIILLSEFLKNVYEKSCSIKKSSDLNATLSGLSQACGYITSNKKGTVKRCLGKYCREQIISLNETNTFRKCSKSILRTALKGKFSKQIVNLLVEQTTELICPTQIQKLEHFLHLNNVIDDFQDICVMINGVNVGNTNIIDGFVIKQNLLGNVDSVKCKSSIRFTILKNIFDTGGIGFGKVQLSTGKATLSSFFKQRVSYFDRLAQILESQGIDLILCSSKIPEHVKTILTRKFCILENVAEEDTARISKHFGILPIETIEEALHDDVSCKMELLSGINELVIGTECFVKLCPSDQGNHHEPYNQLILCSPYPAIGQQYYSAVLNSLKAVKMCFYDDYGCQDQKNNGHLLKFMPAAGCSEVCISACMRYEAINETDEYLRVIYESLSNAFMQIPKLLHKNSNNQHCRFVEVEKLLLEIANDPSDDGCLSFGIDCKNGGTFDPLKIDIIEPFSCKILLFTNVLEVAQQILRIEQIVPSKTSVSMVAT